MRKSPFFLAAVALTVVLLAVSFIPISAPTAYGDWHGIAHLGAFAVLGFLWRRAEPRAPLLGVAAAVVAFAFAQEAIEIIGHAHGFELTDALIDTVGVAAGVAAAHVLFRKSS